MAPGWPDQGAAMRRQCPELAASQHQEHVTMTAEPSQNPVTEAVLSLEVRWIFPGQLETAVARWFARFPATTESREDTYLLDPHLPGLSVKVRGGGAGCRERTTSARPACGRGRGPAPGGFPGCRGRPSPPGPRPREP